MHEFFKFILGTVFSLPVLLPLSLPVLLPLSLPVLLPQPLPPVAFVGTGGVVS